MKRKEHTYPLVDQQNQKRSVTTSSLGKVRSVGGFCVAKVRYKYICMLKFNFQIVYKTSLEEQEKYRKACVFTKVLDGMRVSEKALEIISDHPELLLETSHRQQISTGLTNICDDLLHFF